MIDPTYFLIISTLFNLNYDFFVKLQDMDLLSDILLHLKFSGTLYFRTSFTSPWSIKVPSFENVSRFHYAHQGRCLVRIKPEKAPVLLNQGDLIIITRGAAHTLYCDPTTEGLAVKLDKVVEESGFTGSGVLTYGAKGTHHETQLICGHFAFDDEISHPLIDGLPDHILIQDYDQTAGSWMQSTLTLIGNETGRNALGSNLIAQKLSEIIYAQAIRTYLLSEQGMNNQLAGFTDPAIAKALQAIHATPEKNWTLVSLSDIAGVSRTLLSTKFKSTLSMTPMGYVTHWRMLLAKEKLVDSDQPIIDIAESVGYQSEAAFGRVFKRKFNSGPAGYRKQQKIGIKILP